MTRVEEAPDGGSGGGIRKTTAGTETGVLPRKPLLSLLEFSLALLGVLGVFWDLSGTFLGPCWVFLVIFLEHFRVEVGVAACRSLLWRTCPDTRRRTISEP